MKPPPVWGDTVSIGQVIFNLIDNALKYTHEGGKVEVSLKSEGDSAVLTVSDTGVGIGAEDIPHLFDRFYRVDKARTREAGGAGLGLSICNNIVETHGGRIEVRSEPGEGEHVQCLFADCSRVLISDTRKESAGEKSRGKEQL